MTGTVIAIDGPLGAGKSTVAGLVAQRLGLAHIDSGATYRVVAFKALEDGVPLDDGQRLERIARTVAAECRVGPEGGLLLSGRVVGAEIRTPEVSEAASVVAALPAVRDHLVGLQRRLVPASGAVMDGRDIGTVVLPHATVKVFLDASPDVRRRRRTRDHPGADAGSVRAAQEARDARDAARPVAPMRPAPDAVHIDTTSLDAEEVAERIVAIVRDRAAGPDAVSSKPLPPNPLYRVLRVVLSFLLRTLFRLEVTGAAIPARGAAILAANHRSLLDIPVVGVLTHRKVWFMGKDELFRSRMMDRLFTALGGFPVLRGAPDRRAVKRAIQLLEQGELLGLYPEGTRTPGASFDHVEDGLAYLALKTGAPIVPIALSGTEAIFPPGRKIPVPAKIRVRIGEAFSLGAKAEGVVSRTKLLPHTAEAKARLAENYRALESQS